MANYLMSTDIPIRYFNSSGKTDFQVVVFAKNFSTRTPSVLHSAWQILSAQSIVDFVYPAETSVGVMYKTQGQTVSAGPFPAKPGSTWSVEMQSALGPAILTENNPMPLNPNGTIVVKNVPPASQWGGRKLDIGIYKNRRLLLTHPEVHVGDQIDFVIQPKLYFGVVRNMKVGDTFTLSEVSSTLELFDLSRYPNGIEVTLHEAPDSGRYSFTAESLV